MMDNPIVEELRRAGVDYVESFGHDLDALFKDLRQRQKARGARVVSFSAEGCEDTDEPEPMRAES